MSKNLIMNVIDDQKLASLSKFNQSYRKMPEIRKDHSEVIKLALARQSKAQETLEELLKSGKTLDKAMIDSGKMDADKLVRVEKKALEDELKPMRDQYAESIKALVDLKADRSMYYAYLFAIQKSNSDATGTYVIERKSKTEYITIDKSFRDYIIEFGTSLGLDLSNKTVASKFVEGIKLNIRTRKGRDGQYVEGVNGSAFAESLILAFLQFTVWNHPCFDVNDDYTITRHNFN